MSRSFGNIHLDALKQPSVHFFSSGLSRVESPAAIFLGRLAFITAGEPGLARIVYKVRSVKHFLGRQATWRGRKCLFGACLALRVCVCEVNSRGRSLQGLQKGENKRERQWRVATTRDNRGSHSFSKEKKEKKPPGQEKSHNLNCKLYFVINFLFAFGVCTRPSKT